MHTEKDLHSFDVALINERFMLIEALDLRRGRRRSQLTDIILEAYRMLPYQPMNQYDSVFHMNCLQYDIHLSSLFAQVTPAKGFTDELRLVLKNLSVNTMNSWDSLKMCEDVMIWRSNFISQFDRRIPPDMPHCAISLSSWILMLSRSARSQNLPEIAYQYMASIPPDMSNRYETFENWKEKVMISLDLNITDNQLFKEPEMIQTENLKDDNLGSFYHLKGLYFQKMGNMTEAMGCFTKAYSTYKYVKVCESFSSILYQRWKERGEVNDASQCINFCIQQLCCNNEVSKAMLRLLHIILFSLDNQIIQSHAMNNLGKVPITSWIHYLPLLLSRPSEAQVSVFYSVIKGLVMEFPQLIFYPLYTLCQSLGMPSDNLYNRPTTLFSGTIADASVCRLAVLIY